MNRLFLMLTGKQEPEEFDNEKYIASNNKAIDRFCKKNNLETAAGIRSISAKYVKQWNLKAPGVPSRVEQILSKRATKFKTENDMNLAIECLKKVNELYLVSDFFYDEYTYMRLVRYLKKAGRAKEAEIEEKKIAEHFGHSPSEKPLSTPCSDMAMKKNLELARELGTDLVEVSSVSVCCEKCGKYRGRIFSLSGKDTRFPAFPEDFHQGCGLLPYPFIYGISIPAYSSKEDILKNGQAPLTDTRTIQQKQDFEKRR